MNVTRLQAAPRVAAPRAVQAISRSTRLLLTGAAALALLALFARIMAFELQRDEQFYVSAGVLFSADGLYQQLNFSHLPNLPILLRALYSATSMEHYLLGGRILIFAAWIASLAALSHFAKHYRLGAGAASLLAALMLFNPVLLDAAGMAVTNNFIATPFILFGILAFLRGVEGSTPKSRTLFSAGLLLSLGAGFKANYLLVLPPVGIAALLMPSGASLGTRVRGSLMPLVVGGLIGGLPTFYFVAQDPPGFLAHCLSFHRGPQIAYWQAHPNIHDPKVMGIRDKLLMAHQIWLSGATILLPLLIAVLAATAAYSSPAKGLAWLNRFRTGPIMLMAAIVMISVAASLLPTPSFPQYHSMAFPFAILLIGLMLHALDQPRQTRARPVIAAGLALATIAGGPILFLSLPRLVVPGSWTGIVVHEDAAKLRASVERAGAAGPMATLFPVYALEGGLPVYPQLALGQFVYRASDHIPAGERRHFRNLVSPGTIGAMLAGERPSAILVGEPGPLEDPLMQFGRDNGYAIEKVELRRSEDSAAPLLMVARPKI